jgi:hypothetical protein
MPVSFCWHVLRLCKHLIFHILLRWWHCAEQTYQITFLVLHQTKSASTYTAPCSGISTSSVKVHLGNLVLWACCWTCPSSVIDCWLFSLKHILTDWSCVFHCFKHLHTVYKLWTNMYKLWMTFMLQQLTATTWTITSKVHKACIWSSCNGCAANVPCQIWTQ